MRRSTRWCDEILLRSPQGLCLAKIGLNAGSDNARGSILPSIEMNVLNHLHGPHPAEGIRAFQTGRPADWRPMRRAARAPLLQQSDNASSSRGNQTPPT